MNETACNGPGKHLVPGIKPLGRHDLQGKLAGIERALRNGFLANRTLNKASINRTAHIAHPIRGVCVCVRLDLCREMCGCCAKCAAVTEEEPQQNVRNCANEDWKMCGLIYAAKCAARTLQLENKAKFRLHRIPKIDAHGRLLGSQGYS
jgi:hypothetical protein